MSTQLIYGIHAVTALLARQPERLIEAFVLKGRQDERLEPLLQELLRCGISVQHMNRKVMDDKVQGESHQGIIVRIREGRRFTEQDLPELLAAGGDAPLLLILDGVTDPHNLGACLRSADAAGVCAVIAPKDKSSGLTPVARKVACGAAETVPLVQVTNLARAMRMLKDAGVWIIGTAGETDLDIYQSRLTGALALAMGAEGKGLRRLTREHCDQLVRIPMAGSVSSLNVSVATGICLFEAVRQRMATGGLG